MTDIKDVFTQYINSEIKVIHRRGNMIFVNCGVLKSTDEIFITILDSRDKQIKVINKKSIDNLDIIKRGD